jgi:hypothetical protein
VVSHLKEQVTFPASQVLVRLLTLDLLDSADRWSEVGQLVLRDPLRPMLCGSKMLSCLWAGPCYCDAFDHSSTHENWPEIVMQIGFLYGPSDIHH